MVGGSIRLNSGLVPARYMNGLSATGRINFSAVIEQKRSHSMDLDVVLTDNMVGDLYDAYTDETLKTIRIVFDEPASSIETGENHELEIDMVGKIVSPIDFLGSRDGENTFRVTFESFEDGSGNELSVRVRNAVTAI